MSETNKPSCKEKYHYVEIKLDFGRRPSRGDVYEYLRELMEDGEDGLDFTVRCSAGKCEESYV